jgi:acetyl/propionyl-CoA carboxylase alpha subunit
MLKDLKVLLPNRGVIAASIIKTCREMEIPVVIAHSEQDKEAYCIKYADESICIGKEETNKLSPYMNVEAIIEAGRKMDCNLIHLGTGYLSENHKAVKQFEENGLKHIGAIADQMELASDKVRVIQLALKLGIPVKPGSHKVLENVEEAVKIAQEIGYPVMLKPNNGGGGRGIKKVYDEKSLRENFEGTKSAAKKYFDSEDLYLEKYYRDIYHVEAQMAAGQNSVGKYCVRLLDLRNCTLQRNNQKILEETPPLILTEDQIKKINEWAISIVKRTGYVGVCTVEFVINCEDNQIYLSEINVRIQVEHGPTEMLHRFDLIKAQIKIATGQETTLFARSLIPNGHAMECRIMAEGIDGFLGNFKASEGRTIEKFIPPGGNGIRVDSGVNVGFTLSDFYDSLIANVIVWGKNREESVRRMIFALQRFEIEGIETNIPFHLKVLSNNDFRQGNYNSGLVEKIFEIEKRNQQIEKRNRQLAKIEKDSYQE